MTSPNNSSTSPSSIADIDFFDDAPAPIPAPESDHKALEQEIAGQLPLTPAHLQLDSLEAPPTVATSQKPLVRAAIVLTGIGGLLLLTLSFLFNLHSKPAPPTSATEKTPIAPTTTDEEGTLKSQLAFQGQQQQTEARSPQPASIPNASSTSGSTPTPPPPPPRSISRPASAPPPIEVARPSRAISAPAYRPTIERSQPPAPQATPAEAIDPFERWAQLASLGNMASTSNPAELSSTSATSTPEAPTPDPAGTTVLVSAPSDPAAIELPADPSIKATQTAGTIGILERRPADTVQLPPTIAPDTTAQATVTLPLIWESDRDASSRDSAAHRFLLKLDDPLLDSTGVIALPAGSVIVAEASDVGADGTVAAVPVAIVYSDRNGFVHQQTISPETLALRGEDDEPLRARSQRNQTDVNLRRALLHGVLGGLGRLGETLSQPDVQTRSHGWVSEQTVTTDDSQLVAVALGGFFNTALDELDRQTSSSDRQSSAEDLQILPRGTAVSVIVTQPFQLENQDAQTAHSTAAP
ncbi:hypothetical protein H6F67_25715 [Microcoleus sp. FACHB-1515]|uniref:hypothetical protein n=1 Tax=Cyanophyceae TaxID=3028117 RepID=UPI00168531B9|nr:hypothetical protein [Microcoleus sp. FACHB-1515]MBD2093246.1 hypothetical protein [Microcoleus sp. FACHB-1515]